MSKTCEKCGGPAGVLGCSGTCFRVAADQESKSAKFYGEAGSLHDCSHAIYDPMCHSCRVTRAQILQNQGLKHDHGKPRWSLLPLAPVQRIVEVLTFGAKKYSPNNWQKVENARERYTDALFRHVAAWVNGERNDPESGLHHLAHAGCCIVFLLWFEEQKP